MISKQHGFTLVEVVIAMLILSVGVLAWAANQNQNVESRTVSSELTTAAELTQSRVESLASDVTGWSSNDDGTNGTDSFNENGINYNLSWRVHKGEEFAPGGRTAWKISVNATWDHYGTKRMNLERMVMGR
jgi:type IV pilus assembly protein PilV